MRSVWISAAAAAVALGGCASKSRDKAAGARPGSDAGAPDATARRADGPVTLAPPPPVPTTPPGLPPLPGDVAPTPAEVALGELLFHEPKLGADGTTACASCHDPAHGLAGTEAHPATAAGRPSLRRAPALVNLAWATDLGWDGRGSGLAGWLPNHARGQLDRTLDDIALTLTASPTYRAHLARTSAGRSDRDTVAAALAAYVVTRFAGGSAWDAHEAGAAGAVGDDVVAGYQLFTGKARCGSCHAPPLYTDHDYHRLGLIASPDDGRGRVDPALAGAFKTPGLRGAAARARFFHDGSAASLADAIDWHLAGGRGQGADPSVIDPGLPPVTLTPDERAQLGAFVAALTAAEPPPARPTLPGDLP
jgi:cytochrome c peroxidase